MITDYSNFNYNTDFTPSNPNLFNVNTSNKRYVGIGTLVPDAFLHIQGNVATTDMYIKNSLTYNSSTSNNYNNNFISLLQFDNKDTIIAPNLISAIYESSGVEWSIVNNDNIKLTLRNYADNTRLDFFTSIYNCNSNIFKLNLYPSTTLTLRYIYIIKNNNSVLNTNDINTINNSNITIKVDNIESSLYTSSSPFFKFKNYITLQNNQSYTVIINNLDGYKIQIFGVYDYYSGSLWHQKNNNTYNLNNVGIGTVNPSETLHIIGNAQFTNNTTIQSNLNVNNITSNNFTVKGNGILSNIEPIKDTIIINPNKKPIGIGTTIITEYIHIGNKFKIEKNGSIIFNNLNITNNINFSTNNNISTNTSIGNNSFSIMLNNNSNIIYKYKNKTLINDNNDSININNRVNIIQHNKNYNTIPAYFNDNLKLFVDGNVSFSGNLSVDKIKKLYYDPLINSNSVSNNMNTLYANTMISDNLYSDAFLYTDKLNSNDINVIKKVNIPIKTTDTNTGSYPLLYYNNDTNKYMIYDTVYSYEIYSNKKLFDYSKIIKVFTEAPTSCKVINSDFIKTDTLNNNKVLLFDEFISFYYNSTSMREELVMQNNNNNVFFDLMF